MGLVTFCINGQWVSFTSNCQELLQNPAIGRSLEHETLNIHRPGCRTYIFIYTYVISFRPGLFLHCFFGIGAGCCRHRSWYGESWTLWVDAGEPLRQEM